MPFDAAGLGSVRIELWICAIRPKGRKGVVAGRRAEESIKYLMFDGVVSQGAALRG